MCMNITQLQWVTVCPKGLEEPDKVRKLKGKRRRSPGGGGEGPPMLEGWSLCWFMFVVAQHGLN